MDTKFVATMTVEEFRTIIAEEVQKKISENTPPPTEIFLSPKETSSTLGISLQTLANHTKTGTFVNYHVGRKVLYKKSEILAALVTFKKYQTVKAAA